jgi:hypothetical protein
MLMFLLLLPCFPAESKGDAKGETKSDEKSTLLCLVCCSMIVRLGGLRSLAVVS